MPDNIPYDVTLYSAHRTSAVTRVFAASEFGARCAAEIKMNNTQRNGAPWSASSVIFGDVTEDYVAGTPTRQAKLNLKFLTIAQDKISPLIETLFQRESNRLNVMKIFVPSIGSAMQAAYDLGRARRPGEGLTMDKKVEPSLIAELRLCGLSGAQIARAVGVSRQRVNQIMKRDGDPNPAANARVRLVDQTCPGCGKDYRPRSRTQRSCSHQCAPHPGRNPPPRATMSEFISAVIEHRSAGLTWREIVPRVGLASISHVMQRGKRWSRALGMDWATVRGVAPRHV